MPMNMCIEIFVTNAHFARDSSWRPFITVFTSTDSVLLPLDTCSANLWTFSKALSMEFITVNIIFNKRKLPHQQQQPKKRAETVDRE